WRLESWPDQDTNVEVIKVERDSDRQEKRLSLDPMYAPPHSTTVVIARIGMSQVMKRRTPPANRKLSTVNRQTGPANHNPHRQLLAGQVNPRKAPNVAQTAQNKIKRLTSVAPSTRSYGVITKTAVRPTTTAITSEYHRTPRFIA